MRTLHHVAGAEAKRRIAEETLDIYAPLAGRIGMQEMREELEDLSFRELYPEAYNVVTERLFTLALRNKDLTADIEQQLTRKLADRGIVGQGQGPPEARLFDLAQDGTQVGRLRATVRHFRVPGDREDRDRVLPGARHRAHHLAGRAGPLQGLHLDAEAERLSLDPHHRDRSRQAARRAADPHRGDGRDRRIRHRRACALQGSDRLADRDAVA